jgi:hypothetical protein
MIKKLNNIILGFTSVAALAIAIVAAPISSTTYAFEDGDGSEETPYRIGDCQDLQDINNDLNAYYVLANNIDCSDTINWNGGAGFLPIGSSVEPFLGELDGDYFRIHDLFIDTTVGANNSGGLFNRIGQSDNQVGLVHDLGLQDINVTGGWSTGGLVGVLYGQVNNTYTTGEVNGSGEVGGLVGSHGGVWDTVIDSWSSAAVTGTSDAVGGLVGFNAQDSNIINSYAVGQVVGGDDYVGGLVGINDGNITNTYASGWVSGNDHSVGGLVGRNSGSVTLSSAVGHVWGENDSVGGFVGRNLGNITKSYSKNDLGGSSSTGVIGDCNVGGFVGLNTGPDAVINNSYTRSTSTTDTLACPVGGFVGVNEADIYQTYSTGNASGGLTDFAGFAGAASDVDSANIVVSFWDTQLSGNNTACGGLSTFDCDGSGLNVIPKNSSELKTQSTYIDGLSEGAWDFDNTWTFTTGANDNYPVLRDVGTTTVEWIERQSEEDLNGDNIPDAEQPNVGGYANSYTGKMVAIDVGENCELTVDDMTEESQLNAQDLLYDYSNGLWDFEADCGTPGSTTTIKLFYYDISFDGLSVRKFNPNTNQYFDIPGATLTQQTINGSNVVVATYQITDGGNLDMDSEANGEIVDPAGVATLTATSNNALASTGNNPNHLLVLSLFIAMLSLMLRKKYLTT